MSLILEAIAALRMAGREDLANGLDSAILDYLAGDNLAIELGLNAADRRTQRNDLIREFGASLRMPIEQTITKVQAQITRYKSGMVCDPLIVSAFELKVKIPESRRQLFKILCNREP